MSSLNSIGHLVIGVAAIAAATVLGVLHDVTGGTAIDVVIAIAGVTIGAHIATTTP